MRTSRSSSLTILAVIGFLLVSDVGFGQLFQRRFQVVPPPCPNGNCQQAVVPISQPIVQPVYEAMSPSAVVNVPPATEVKAGQELNASQWYQILVGPGGRRVTAVEDETVRSFARRATRIINGNSCGTGNLCGRDDQFIYILTNAHVAGTRIGHVVRCQALVNNTVEVFNATVIEAAYSSRTRTDWALLRAPANHMAGIEPIKLSKERPDPQKITGTWGCPRCEVPRGQVIETVRFGSVWLWQPNSIGGQSGSAVIQDGLEFGLLTWSEGGNGSGQFTATIYAQSVGQNTDGPARTGAEIPVSPTFGVELKEGYHAEDRETGLGEYPIWHDGADDGSGDPQPPGSAEPDNSPERRLFDRLRNLRRNDTGTDWLAIINLILQLIEILAKR